MYFFTKNYPLKNFDYLLLQFPTAGGLRLGTAKRNWEKQ